MSKDLILVSWGGIGDAIVCIPTIKELKRKAPDCRIILYCGNNSHLSVFDNNPYIDSLRLLKFKYLWKHPRHILAFIHYRYPNFPLTKYRTPYILLNFQYIPLSWAYDRHVIDIVPDIFRFKLSDRRIEFFFTKKEEAWAKERMIGIRNPVFIHVYSKSSKNHHWEIDKWEKLVKGLSQFTFIQFGNINEPVIVGALDWRGKTTYREALCIMKLCVSFVGIDSSFSHATNAFDLPGVVLFGDSSPTFWGHSNNINIYKGLPCSPCYYDLWGRKCPYGNECMNLITVEEVAKALLKQTNI